MARRRVHAVLSARALPAWLFLLYMAPRAAVLLLRPLQQSSDFAWYYQRGLELAATGCYCQAGVPTAFWPVGWPGFLGLAAWLFGPDALVGQIANLGFAAAIFWLTVALGARLGGDRRVGHVAALLLALYPNQIGYVPLLSAELFYEALLLLALWLLVGAGMARAWRRVALALAAGLVFGLASLTKAQTLLLPGFLLGVLFLAAPSRRGLARLCGLGAVASLGMLLVVAPWSWRNHQVFGGFVAVSTNGGWTLLTGNNPQARGDYTPETTLAAGLSGDPSREVEMDREARRRAVAWIAANPGRFLALLPLKVMRLWAPDGEAEWFYQQAPGRGFAGYDANRVLFRAVRVLNQGWYVLMLLLALPEIWAILTRRRGAGDGGAPWWAAGVAICLYATLVSMAFSGQSRFHASLMPLIALYAGATLVRAVDRAAAGRTLLPVAAAGR